MFFDKIDELLVRDNHLQRLARTVKAEAFFKKEFNGHGGDISLRLWDFELGFAFSAVRQAVIASVAIGIKTRG